MIEALQKDYRADHGNVGISYEPRGTPEGVRSLLDGKVDFAGADCCFSARQALGEKSGSYVYVPLAAWSAAIVCNLGKASHDVVLDGRTLSLIYSGEITNWNDARIRALNENIKLPSQPITVVTSRSPDACGYLLASYLSANSRFWKDPMNRGELRWPVGLRETTPEHQLHRFILTDGAITCVSSPYASSQEVPSIRIVNRDGFAIAPTEQSTEAALEAYSASTDFCSDAIDMRGRKSYPLVSVIGIVAVKDRDKRSHELQDFLTWALRDGARHVPSGLLAIPERARTETLGTITDRAKPSAQRP